jgi:hypothetical protein
MPVFCFFTLGRHGNFTAGVTMEQPAKFILNLSRGNLENKNQCSFAGYAGTSISSTNLKKKYCFINKSVSILL